MPGIADLIQLAIQQALMGGGTMTAGGAGIPSPDVLKWQQVQQNAALPAPNPATLTQTQALPPGQATPTQFQDPTLPTPEEFAQDYADKTNRNELIRGGIGGLAGLLLPSGPGGHRSWLGQIGSGIESGLNAYGTAEQADDMRNLRQGQLSNQNIRTQLAGARVAQGQERIDLGQVGRWKVQADQTGQMFSVNPATGESKAVLKPDGTPMSAAEKDSFTFHDTDRGLIALDKRTGTAGVVAAPGGGTYGRAPASARPAADTTSRDLAEARREWMAESVDPATGLPRDDAMPFMNWLKNEWPKRKAAISESGSAAPGSPPGTPRGASPGRPDIGRKVDVAGRPMTIVRYAPDGRAVVRDSTGKEYFVNPKTAPGS